MADLVLSLLTSGKRALAITGAAADTLNLTDTTSWMPLEGVGGFAVYVECVTPSATISTAFALKAYVKNPITGRVFPAEKFNIGAGTQTGARGELLDSFEVDSDVGSIAYQPSAGATSAGNMQIQIIPSGKPGAGELL